MKQENLKKFIDYGNPLDTDSVFCMFIGQLMACAVIVVLSYNWLKALIVLTPLIIIGLVINIIFLSLKEKRKTNKYIFLFFGMMGILFSLTCDFGCFLIIKLTLKQKLIMAIILLILTLLMFVLVILISKKMILNANKLSKAEVVSAAVITPFVAIGLFATRNIVNIYQTNIFLFIFSGLSFIFNIFSIYIVKYLCILKYEKMQSEDA